MKNPFSKNKKNKDKKKDKDVVIAKRGDWNCTDMPEKHVNFILNYKFTEDQMNRLRRGNIPKEMEDKWFWFMEGNTLYIHRSWTGYCIYIVDFSDSDEHKVTVNNDPDEYGINDIESEKSFLVDLLIYWSEKKYNYSGLSNIINYLIR